MRQHANDAVIAKLRGNIPLTAEDVRTLEKILWSEAGTQQDYEAEYGQKPLGEFVREIVGLDMNAAKEAFARYLNDASLDSRQIYFVNQIVEYIVHNGMLKDLSVLQEPPFTDHGSVVEVFTDVSVWVGIRVGGYPAGDRADQCERSGGISKKECTCLLCIPAQKLLLPRSA